MNPILSSSAVTCYWGPGRFSEPPSARQPECVHGTGMGARHGKDFGIQPAGAPFPLFNIRFDLPLAIVSKDQRMSITF